MSEITFKTGDQELTRHADIPYAELVAQATREFGTIDLISFKDGNEEPSSLTTSHIAVLEATLHNMQTSLDQLTSLDDDNPLEAAKAHQQAAISEVKEELETLRG